jgi:flagellar biosynthetic protein FliQ
LGEGVALSGAEVLDIAREGIWTLIIVAGPMMIVGLVVGVIIALIQALTQIQEMTLVFVPKMAAMFIGGMLLLPFMMTTLTDYMEQLSAMITAID